MQKQQIVKQILSFVVENPKKVPPLNFRRCRCPSVLYRVDFDVFFWKIWAFEALKLWLLGYGKIQYGKWRCNVCTVEPRGTNKKGKYEALKQFELHYEAEHEERPLCMNFCLKLLSVVNFSLEIPIWNWPRCRVRSERDLCQENWLSAASIYLFHSTDAG